MSRFSVAYVRRAVNLLGAVLITGLTGSWAFAGDTAAPPLRAVTDPASGQIDVVEGDRPVMRYNYQTVQPPEGLLDRVQPDNRKYAQPRSDYIHPLFGLDGETLTLDWPKDHPHHRGVYWAWPEIDYRGQRGDLHALQSVCARPTGRIELRNEDGWSEIEAENVWKWEDLTPVVLEIATIRAWRSGEHGRFIDLVMQFQAIEDDVALARRESNLYGGLNLRLSPTKGLKITLHTDPAEAAPRASWGEASGIWGEGDQPAGFVVFQHRGNPQYPGQWIEYARLPWFQPTFPTAMTRYVLQKGHPLTLQYRLWLHRGNDLTEEAYRRQWLAYQQASGGQTGPSATSSPPSHE